ncbi:MAG: hypothetical protein H0U44_06975 [Flavisolibacter sp.]|nr:hypothetical protein [Flavisolibacter sp.]
MNDEHEEPQKEAAWYFNEEGLMTFTAYFLLKRGYCCGNGCRHCPYNYEAVPEPLRSQLIKNRPDGEGKTSKGKDQ